MTTGFYEKHRVTLPEMEQGAWRVERFEIEQDDIYRHLYMLEGRDPGHGTFTRITHNGRLWMSDTNAEIRDHLGAIGQIEGNRWGTPGAASVLIHGLGIGMVLQAALRAPSVQAVDVVEIDQEVIDLVGPHYKAMAEEHRVDLTIHCDNALTKKWPTGQHWDVVWHDIWPDICADNLDEMSLLHRRFGRRSGWQGSWCHREVRRRAGSWA